MGEYWYVKRNDCKYYLNSRGIPSCFKEKLDIHTAYSLKAEFPKSCTVVHVRTKPKPKPKPKPAPKANGGWVVKHTDGHPWGYWNSDNTKTGYFWLNNKRKDAEVFQTISSAIRSLKKSDGNSYKYCNYILELAEPVGFVVWQEPVGYTELRNSKCCQWFNEVGACPEANAKVYASYAAAQKRADSLNARSRYYGVSLLPCTVTCKKLNGEFWPKPE